MKAPSNSASTEVPHARTLIPFDNPQGLCEALRRVIAAHPAPVARGAA
ncbi:hypothetical protein [Streptomyces sp. NBC_01244]|nr:hypothetical protein OG247_14775 [Streptomyces sp. NBC_01244]